jgi:hypothetical protein
MIIEFTLGKTALFEQWHSHLVFPGYLRCREAASCRLLRKAWCLRYEIEILYERFGNWNHTRNSFINHK